MLTAASEIQEGIAVRRAVDWGYTALAIHVENPYLKILATPMADPFNFLRSWFGGLHRHLANISGRHYLD